MDYRGKNEEEERSYQLSGNQRRPSPYALPTALIECKLTVDITNDMPMLAAAAFAIFVLVRRELMTVGDGSLTPERAV
jgi:hypothetical protein